MQSATTIGVFINKTEYRVDKAAVAVVGLQNDHTITCDVTITPIHINLLIKMLLKTGIIPIIDITTHEDVFKVLVLSKALGIPVYLILEGFGMWTDHFNWINLDGAAFHLL